MARDSGRQQGVPPRIRWALDVLAIDPAERVLEVGGGTGRSAELVCRRLTTGRLVAVDRSPTATARIAATCAEHLVAGRLTVVTAPLADLGEHVAPSSVDVAFSVDVNLFWTSDATAELAALRRALVAGGRLAVMYGAAGPHPERVQERVLDPVATHVADAGFVAVEVLTESEGVGVVCRSTG